MTNSVRKEVDTEDRIFFYSKQNKNTGGGGREGGRVSEVGVKARRSRMLLLHPASYKQNHILCV